MQELTHTIAVCTIALCLTQLLTLVCLFIISAYLVENRDERPVRISSPNRPDENRL